MRVTHPANSDDDERGLIRKAGMGVRTVGVLVGRDLIQIRQTQARHDRLAVSGIGYAADQHDVTALEDRASFLHVRRVNRDREWSCQGGDRRQNGLGCLSVQHLWRFLEQRLAYFCCLCDQEIGIHLVEDLRDPCPEGAELSRRKATRA